MEVPTIYDIWHRKGEHSLYSTALITDEPLEEVAAAGHDRTPVSLTVEAVHDWLTPNETEKEQLLLILDNIKRPYYEHAVAA